MDEPSVMGTENALMAAALTPGPTTIGNAACEPHVQDLARLLVAMGAEIDGIGSNVMTVHGRDKLGGAEHRISPRPHRGRAASWRSPPSPAASCASATTEPEDLHGIRRQFRRLGLQSMVEGQRRPRPAGPAARGPRRRRRRDPEDRRRALAGVPRRPDLDRARARDAGAGHDHDLREDVREPPLLRRQARRYGRSDRPLRSPPGDRQRSEPSSRRAAREPRHPRRDGDAHRRARGRRQRRRSATSSRSTAATSGSTSACAASAPTSSASTKSPIRRRPSRSRSPPSAPSQPVPARLGARGSGR